MATGLALRVESKLDGLLSAKLQPRLDCCAELNMAGSLLGNELADGEGGPGESNYC
jgi:hypothetical protein